MQVYNYDNVDDALPWLLEDLMSRGNQVPSRNGATWEFLNIGVTLTKPWQREILLPHRKANLAAQIAETMWVLSGRDDIAWLSHYLPRAPQFSDDGKVWRGAYGPRIRKWSHEPMRTPGVDQLAHVINLLREDPNTRRAIISIYDPVVDTQPGKDIPCNNWIAFNARDGYLHTHVAIRSNDIMWGWSGINAFEWSALQEIVAGMADLQVGPLNFSVASMHLYEQHWDKAAKLAADCDGVGGGMADSPRFVARVVKHDLGELDNLIKLWFEFEENLRNGVGVPVQSFPEPMLRSWLHIIRWWWQGDSLDHIAGTRLYRAAQVAMQPKKREPSMVEAIDELHRDKHAAYGNSWKRRGEMLGIMANIARKIDRLGTNSADETSKDTAIDLLVYLCKYRWWLVDEQGAPFPIGARGDWVFPYSDHTEPIKALMEWVDLSADEVPDVRSLERALTAGFEDLEVYVNSNNLPTKIATLNRMIKQSFQLVKALW